MNLLRGELPASKMVVGLEMSLSETREDEEDDLERLWWLYCLLTARYSSKAGMVFDSFGSISTEPNPNPRSMHAFSSSMSSSERLLLGRWRRQFSPLTLWLSFRRCHASSRSMSGDHDCCL